MVVLEVAEVPSQLAAGPAAARATAHGLPVHMPKSYEGLPPPLQNLLGKKHHWIPES